jgi:hypothetical protein
MMMKATVHRTAMVLSLARNPASCWSSTGDMPTTCPLVVIGGVEGSFGEDPHDERKLGTIDWTIR